MYVGVIEPQPVEFGIRRAGGMERKCSVGRKLGRVEQNCASQLYSFEIERFSFAVLYMALNAEIVSVATACEKQ